MSDACQGNARSSVSETKAEFTSCHAKEDCVRLSYEQSKELILLMWASSGSGIGGFLEVGVSRD